MTDIPAGWYDDPEHPAQFRYWDGAQWTEHRSPKTTRSPGGDTDGVWSVVSASFRLVGRGWRELVVLSLPLIAVTIAAGLLALASLDAIVEPGIGDILDRVGQPGFDPVNDADDEAFVESIDLSVTAAPAAGIVLATVLFFAGGTVASVAFTVFLAALRRDRTLSVSETYRIALVRLPRIIGILLLWTVVGLAVLMPAAVVVAIAVLISPLMLLLIAPLTLAAVIYGYPFGALASTTLTLAPTDDPPFRRTITLVRRQWGFVALRLLVLTLVFWAIGFGSSAVTTPFSAASVWGGFLASMVVQSLQTVLSTAGSVVLYDVADGPLDPAIATPDQTS